MSDIFCFLFILGVSVVFFMSQDVEGSLKKSQKKRVAQNTEPVDFDDYDEPRVGDYCFKEHKRCELDKISSVITETEDILKYVAKPICVYTKKMGLTNFYGLCTINLSLCLKTHQKKLQDGSTSLGDEIYHNGKHFDCQYYGEHIKSERQGIKWYFKLGGLNAETEEITQPFENIL